MPRTPVIIPEHLVTADDKLAATAEALGYDFPDGESFEVSLERVERNEMTCEQAVRLAAVEQALCAAIDFCNLDDSDEDAYLCTRETVELLPIFADASNLGGPAFDDQVRAARTVAVDMLPAAPPRKPMPVPPSARV